MTNGSKAVADRDRGHISDHDRYRLELSPPGSHSPLVDRHGFTGDWGFLRHDNNYASVGTCSENSVGEETVETNTNDVRRLDQIHDPN